MDSIVQQWEHLNVVIRFNHQNGCIRETITNGKKQTYPEGEQFSIQAYLADLKQDGWDLMGIVGIDTYLFSRMVKGEK